MEPLKEVFNNAFYTHLAAEFTKADKTFKASKFINEVTKDIEPLSLNERLRKTSLVLKNYLPANYASAIDLMMKVIPNTKSGYTNLVFPDYVGLFGHDDFKTSMQALKFFTQFGSSEFAIREFLKRDFEKTIKVMELWATDKNYHVRRLASEGSRPRLPWSFKLDTVIKNPKSTSLILNTLKTDSELYVKKSVANHLNDISKDNTNHMLALISTWDKHNQHTAWIVKHASRNLIKKGNLDSLHFFSFEKHPKISLDNFKLINPKLKLGDSLHFEFNLTSKKLSTQKLVIDYSIHYQKKSGSLSKKVFKLKEIELKPKEKISISKKQLFKDFTTRKHYPGIHYIELQINGKLIQKLSFDLTTT
jgi:3-methyladenine DNA glycosylase AlkC